MKVEQELPQTKIARARLAGMAAAKVAANRFGHFARNLFMRAPAAESRFDAEARMVFEALSRMKGPALKLAQALSMEGGWLPEEYRREFSKAHYQVPALDRDVVRQVLFAEFGRWPDEMFRNFEATAFAAASLGQVHRAQAADGTQIAVKVQYPGVRNAVEADLTICRRLLAPIMRSSYVSRVISEIEARFVEEVDYVRELENTEWFRDRIRVNGVKIPKPYAELSGSTVLATELLPGLHLEEWLATHPPREVVDRAAQSLWDVFCVSFFEWGRMHSDPNPGNYLFSANGAIGLIDFGCVKRFPPDMRDIVAHFMRAEIRGDRRVIRDMMAAMGVDLDSLSEEGWDLIEKIGRKKSLPFRQDAFDFGEQEYDAAEIVKLAQSSKEIAKGRLFEEQTAETVMFDRSFHGLFNVFKRMRAKVRLRNRWIH